MDRSEIIDYLAKKHNKTKKEIEKAVQSQIECIAYVMKKGGGESIRLPYFGKFDVHPYRLKKLKENSNGRTLKKST